MPAPPAGCRRYNRGMEVTMTITPEQKRAVEQAGGEPVELTDPNTNTAYYLIRADVFRELRDVLEDERQRAAIARKAKRNAASRMDEP